jgi:drug/metabolite transporter (DMT)-like permease
VSGPAGASASGGTLAARTGSALSGSLAAVVAASLFGMLGPLTRFASDAGLPGIGMTAWRACLGLAFLVVVIAVRGAGRESIGALRALSPVGRAALAVAALSGFVLNASIFTAFGLVPVALALMLFYTYPAGVAIVDVVAGHEQLTPWRAAALALSMGGVVLVLAGGMGGAASGAIAPVGILLGLLASASQVVFVTVSRRGYRSLPADLASLVIMATAVVGAVAVALLTGQGSGLLVPFTTPQVWPLILLAGVAAAGISSVLFLLAIRQIGGTRTGILMLFEPVVGVLLAAVLLGESMTPTQIGGAALVLLGALVLQRRSEPELEPMLETAAGPIV